jgi:hypothetical protein
MFVTISAIGSVRVKTCHPSCWRVSLEIRALCGQGSKGSDMTWLWVLSVPSTPGIKVHISLLPRRADYHYIRHDRWIETLLFKESVSLQAIPMSKPCKANTILASTWLSVVNIIIVLPLFLFLTLYLEGQTASSDKCLILTFLFPWLWRHVLLQVGVIFTVEVVHLVLNAHPQVLHQPTFENFYATTMPNFS